MAAQQPDNDSIAARPAQSQDDNPDPFWQSTPRSPLTSIASLMTTTPNIHTENPGGHQHASQSLSNVPPSSPLQKLLRRLPPLPARRPTCTHMTVDRVYGEALCQLCGQVPSIGWLYACRQKTVPVGLCPLETEELPIVPDNGDFNEVMATLAESLKISDSVVHQIRTGAYNFDQIAKLIQQKEHLNAVIRSIESCSSERPQVGLAIPDESLPNHAENSATTPPTGMGSDSIISNDPSVATPNMSVAASQQQGEGATYMESAQGCGLQICHTCRPFFRERLYISLGSVLNGEQAAVTEEEMQHLPVHRPAIAANLGLRVTTYGSQSALGNDRVSTSFGSDWQDEISVDWTPTSGSSCDSRGTDLYPCPGAGICPLYSLEDGCAYDHGFDDGQRAWNHGYYEVHHPNAFGGRDTPHKLRRVNGSNDITPPTASSTTSSISLPTPINSVPVTPHWNDHDTFEAELAMTGIKHGKAKTVCGAAGDEGYAPTRFFLSPNRISGSPSRSTLGGEVEVDGGVALTEEAVENRTPDIADMQE